ncbi:helix-turn-helix domain-containing protein [Chryseobacterium koreense]|uniref:AraC family transcriptional regulator n=1 Tax=Chryseobacterium koreense CCUG 49689 TaxID=1304281 RepID=A0A0J7LMP4_9FLAO|nr:AraC family transcriptional regulator [Chryseobacterium koreense]KMQ70370.1 AraC family transcriptional regulator [Chryseobacterium koreense CCUG 49689]MBB5333372.1 AraC-like DNA-binding protein [Chryseobacterium koreense]
MKTLFSLTQEKSTDFQNSFSDEFYHIFLFEGKGKINVDFVKYGFEGKTVFFTSPFQNIQILPDKKISIQNLSFHGDFYCIEYHKKEVACNGLLFNNIYQFPNLSLNTKTFNEISEYFSKIEEIDPNEEFSGAVLRSYLQLILAISSKVKSKLLTKNDLVQQDLAQLKTFQSLVELHYTREKSPAFYADLLHISPNTLSKKIKTEFHKTPSQIIQERVILEAKKQIHLTRKSIKEIAAELHFEDEFYFSKYFKKHTGISPTKFREEVGISVVADL